MLNSSLERTQDFLRKAEELGLIDELNLRIEERDHQRRKELVAAMNALPPESKTDLPKMEKATAEAHRALETAKAELHRAQGEYNIATQRGYGARNQFEGQKFAIEKELRAICPDVISRAYADLGYLEQEVSCKTHFSIESHWTFGGRVHEEKSNVAEINTFRVEIAASKIRLMAMAFEAAEPEIMKTEVASICQRIQKRSFALGVDEKEFNQRHAPADPLIRTENARLAESRKRAAAILSFPA